jgi:hypothetical protein
VARNAEEAEASVCGAAARPGAARHSPTAPDGISAAEALLRHRRVPLIFITVFSDAPTLAGAAGGAECLQQSLYDGRRWGTASSWPCSTFAWPRASQPTDNGEPADGTVPSTVCLCASRPVSVKVPLRQLKLLLEADDGYTHLHTVGQRKFTLCLGRAELLAHCRRRFWVGASGLCGAGGGHWQFDQAARGEVQVGPPSAGPPLPRRAGWSG